MAKTPKEHLNADKKVKKILMEKDFAGIKKGEMMLVATPQIVDQYIKKIPYGKTKTIQKLRSELARRRGCDASCPVSTSIFIRISAQVAIEDLNDGEDTSNITPFWRVLTSKDKISKKLDIDLKWLDLQRELESA